MNRRTLLGFLAAIPGFAFLAPKRAEALSVRRTEIQVIGPDDPNSKPLGFKMYDWMPYFPGTHTKFYKMLADIRRCVEANPGCEVLPCDEPKRGQIGYAVGGPNSYHSFTIAVHDLKSRYSLLGFSEARSNALREMIRSSAGRLQLAKVLAGQSQLPS